MMLVFESVSPGRVLILIQITLRTSAPVHKNSPISTISHGVEWTIYTHYAEHVTLEIQAVS